MSNNFSRKKECDHTYDTILFKKKLLLVKTVSIYRKNSLTTSTAYLNQFYNRIEITWGEHVSDDCRQGGEKRSQEHADRSNIDCQVKERLEKKW